jgi:inner membrane protein
MPTILTHALVPLALGAGLGSARVSRPLLITAIVASMLPDIDVLSFRLGIAYGDVFGHRGATHSIGFALLLGLIALVFARRLGSSRLSAFVFVAISAFSHGLLDMLTNGGHGVALLWPISAVRMFAPWQVIEVSPLGLHRFLDGRGVAVLESEIMWVWLPALVAWILLSLLRPSDHEK